MACKICGGPCITVCRGFEKKPAKGKGKPKQPPPRPPKRPGGRKR